MKILVPVEDPLFGAAIVDFIARHTWPAGSQFIVVHVIEPYLLDQSPHITFAKLLEANAKQVIADATKMVNSVAHAINNSHPDAVVSQEVVQAHIKEQIIRMADKWQADLVIAGTHGRSGFSRFILGSVSLCLTSELKVPLILVRPDAETLKTWESLDYPTLVHQSVEKNWARIQSERKIRRVLIALDETTLSNQLIEFVTRHSWDAQCEFRLLTACKKASAFLLPPVNAHELSDELAKIAEMHLQDFSHVISSELRNSRVETEVRRGQAKSVILSAASDWKADLLIVGCHFQNSIKKFLLGGVSLPTLSEAPCSVLLVKEKQPPVPSTNKLEADLISMC